MTKIDTKMEQEKELIKILEKNKSLQSILDRAEGLNLPGWYVGSGGITQTVWNIKHNFDPEKGIVDYDLVYCDTEDTSLETQDLIEKKGEELFEGVPVPVEIVNEARVYLWYKKELGYDRDQDPYNSTEEAIQVWPTTATAIGVRKEKNGKYKIFAPFGLDDLFNLVVRPNKGKVSEMVYNKKVDRWSNIWPNLKVIPWS